MFDHETRSLWNTFEGVPVVGSLAGSGVRLTPHAVVTTTWGEWRQRHPATTVLSLNAGYRRDYSEGAAYRDYFSSDELMFQVASRDDRLRNKAEVLVMRLGDPNRGGRRQPLAIAVSFLERNRVFHHSFAGRNLAVVTSERGANRAYDAQDLRLAGHLDEQRVADQMGRVWPHHGRGPGAGHRSERAAGPRPGATGFLVRLVCAVSGHGSDSLTALVSASVYEA